MVKSSKTEIEQDGKKLLDVIVKNAKENLDTIAKNCGFSKQKARRMIKQLEAQHLIWGYTAVFDEKKIGLNHFTLLMKRSNTRLKEKTVEQIISREGNSILKDLDPYIETSAFVHGEYDWMTSFLAKDLQEAKKYVSALWGHYSGDIEKILLLQTLMYVKKQYILNPERNKLKELM